MHWFGTRCLCLSWFSFALPKAWHSDFSASTSVVTSLFTVKQVQLSFSGAAQGMMFQTNTQDWRKEEGNITVSEKCCNIDILILVALINFWIMKLVTLNKPIPECIINIHLIKYFLIWLNLTIKQFSRFTNKVEKIQLICMEGNSEFGLLEQNFLVWFLSKVTWVTKKLKKNSKGNVSLAKVA